MFSLEIATDNAAFNDEWPRGHEVARILRVAADQLEQQGVSEGKCRDINGNTVGEWAFLDD